MSSDRRREHQQFFIVLAAAFLVGFVVALLSCIIWRSHPSTFTPQLRVAAIALCPSFLLAGIMEATSDATLALVITIGTIVLANGILYAGLASFGYFLATVFFSKRRA